MSETALDVRRVQQLEGALRDTLAAMVLAEAENDALRQRVRELQCDLDRVRRLARVNA